MTVVDVGGTLLPVLVGHRSECQRADKMLRKTHNSHTTLTLVPEAVDDPAMSLTEGKMS